MTASVFVNRSGMDSSTSGTGTITLGSALGAVSPNVCSFLSFAGGGITDGQQVSYLILDSNGAWEVGFGVYTASGTTLTRNVTKSSNSNNAINLSGSEQVFVTARANDLIVTNDAAVTDNTALRADGTGGRTYQTSALAIADTTAALSRVGNGGIPVQGTNTNDSAAAGDVGESSISNISSASAVSLTTNTAANITSLSLTAGDWDLSGLASFIPDSTTAVTQIIAGFSTTTNTLPADDGLGRNQFNVAFSANSTQGLPVAKKRFSLSATTTVYFVARSAFTVSTQTVCGYVEARRVR